MSEWLTLRLDYASILLPRMPLTEVLLRGTLVYLALFIMLRLFPKRDIGSMSMADMLILLLIVEVSGNAVSKNEMSIPDALLTVLVVQFWGYSIDWLCYRYPGLRRFVEEDPSVLVRDGRVDRKALRRELISQEELLAELRKQGVADLSQVRLATLEGDGTVSIVTQEGAADSSGQSTIAGVMASEPQSDLTPLRTDPTTEAGLKQRIAWHDREIEGHLKELRRLKMKLKELPKLSTGKPRLPSDD